MILASEAVEKTLLYPSVLGLLVVIASVIIFFGSTYLLLATNIGSRTGFLVTISTIFGVMVVLSATWATTSFPLNTLKGRIAEWAPVDVVKDPKDSDIDQVKSIQKKGKELTSTEFSAIKAAADTLLAPVPEGEEDPAVLEGKKPAGDFIVTKAYKVGGSKPNILAFELTHQEQYAIAEFCILDVDIQAQAFREVCDVKKSSESGFLVLEYDHGSLRVPAYTVFIFSALMFGLCLYVLHGREKMQLAYSDDENESKSIEAKTAEEKTDEKV